MRSLRANEKLDIVSAHWMHHIKQTHLKTLISNDSDFMGILKCRFTFSMTNMRLNIILRILLQMNGFRIHIPESDQICQCNNRTLGSNHRNAHNRLHFGYSLLVAHIDPVVSILVYQMIRCLLFVFVLPLSSLCAQVPGVHW